ncbi:MAG TPA: hypothetical protein VGX23_04425 [Actinocrinis sp.]|nr:hypothetical protein [Actinocrinis sp.]
MATRIACTAASPSSRVSRGRSELSRYPIPGPPPVAARACAVVVSPPSSSCPPWPLAASSARAPTSRQSVAWFAREGPSKARKVPIPQAQPFTLVGAAEERGHDPVREPGGELVERGEGALLGLPVLK